MSVYLDHAAATPILPEAAAVLTAHLGLVGNANSLHASGRAARRVVEESRETIAAALRCRPHDLIFTSGGTEADNLAVKGIYWGRRAADPARTVILASAVEHHAVLDPLVWLAETAGAEVEYLPVDQVGRIDLAVLERRLAEIADRVALITVMWANNEVGTVQPIDAILRSAARYGIPVHTDAVQALGQVPVDLDAVAVDALTISGHKIGGPHGVGALMIRREVATQPLLHGGGQERDLRSGTLDVPAIASLASAVATAVAHQEAEQARRAALADRLWRGLVDRVPGVHLSGDPDFVGGGRLPGNVHVVFDDCEGDSLLMLLDARGIESSTGSACNAGVPQPSHVLLAMGHSPEQASAALRFSLGHTSTEADVDAVLEVILPVVERARAAVMVSRGVSG